MNPYVYPGIAGVAIGLLVVLTQEYAIRKLGFAMLAVGAFTLALGFAIGAGATQADEHRAAIAAAFDTTAEDMEVSGSLAGAATYVFDGATLSCKPPHGENRAGDLNVTCTFSGDLAEWVEDAGKGLEIDENATSAVLTLEDRVLEIKHTKR